jgi:ADP-ribosylglycohydrolase
MRAPSPGRGCRRGWKWRWTESVPAAIGCFAYAQGDPLRTIGLGASMGNDTDTIAAMAGALCGALVGERALPAALRDEFMAVNEAEYSLRPLAAALAALAPLAMPHPQEER